MANAIHKIDVQERNSVTLECVASSITPKVAFTRRLPALDGLRGLAVIEVFLYHARSPAKNSGWIGVELFLALSGYVITRSLLSEWRAKGRISVVSFIKRRAARIYPALTLFLLAYAVFAYTTLGRSSAKIFAEIIPSFFGFANWTRAYGLKFPRDLGHLWSISTEVQLYLVWAPIVALLLSRSLKSLIWGIFLLAIGCFAYRYSLVFNKTSLNFIYNNSFCRSFPFLFGAIGACIEVNYFQSKKLKTVFKVLAIALFSAALVYHCYELRYCSLSRFGKSNWEPLMISLSAAIIVWGVSTNLIPVLSNFLSQRIPFYLGSISYGVFLWHYPILLYFPREYADYRTVCAAVISLILGCISFELVEKRFLKNSRGRGLGDEIVTSVKNK